MCQVRSADTEQEEHLLIKGKHGRPGVEEGLRPTHGINIIIPIHSMKYFQNIQVKLFRMWRLRNARSDNVLQYYIGLMRLAIFVYSIFSYLLVVVRFSQVLIHDVQYWRFFMVNVQLRVGFYPICSFLNYPYSALFISLIANLKRHYNGLGLP